MNKDQELQNARLAMDRLQQIKQEIIIANTKEEAALHDLQVSKTDSLNDKKRVKSFFRDLKLELYNEAARIDGYFVHSGIQKPKENDDDTLKKLAIDVDLRSKVRDMTTKSTTEDLCLPTCSECVTSCDSSCISCVTDCAISSCINCVTLSGGSNPNNPHQNDQCGLSSLRVTTRCKTEPDIGQNI